MSICISNKSDQNKFDALAKAVGLKEAQRDFLEQDGVVRPPRIVIDKINRRGMDTSDAEDINPLDFNIPTPRTYDHVIKDVQKIITQQNANESLRAAVELSNQLGVEFHIVSSEESKAMRNQEYDVPGFYQAGVVYLTKGQFTPETIFHEFSHPVIKSLAKDPEGMKLFNKLYNDLASEDFGKRIIEDMKNDSYYGKDPHSNHFKEEAIVRAMSHIHNEGLDKNGSWIKNLMYAIRQFLRRSFGTTVNVGNLSIDTTMKDLVDMLNQGDKFSMNLDLLKEDDVLMLQKDYDEAFNDMTAKSKETAQELFNSMSDMVRSQVAGMIPGSIYHEFAKGLSEDDGTGLLQKMRFALEKIASINNKRKTIPGIDNLTDEYLASLDGKDEVEIVAERVAMFVGVMAQADTVMDLFVDRIATLPKGKMTSPKDIDTLFGIGQYVNQWGNFMDTLLTHDTREFMPADGIDTLRHFLDGLQTKIQNLKDDIDSLSIEGVTDIMYEFMVKSNKDADQEAFDEMNGYKETGNINAYNRAHQEYYGTTVEQRALQKSLENKLKLKRDSTGNQNAKLDDLIEHETLEELNALSIYQSIPSRDNFKKMLLGGGIDANYLNIYYEGYNASQDKTVSTFFSFLENVFNKVNGNANKNEAEFLNGLKKHLKATGMLLKKNLFESSIGKAVSQISDVGKLDEHGRVETFEVREFKSNFKGHYQLHLKTLSAEITAAHAQFHHSPNTENEILYIKAKNTLEEFKTRYMNQDMVPEFYESQKLFQDDIGIKARMALDKFYEATDDLSELALDAHLDTLKAIAIQEHHRNYEYLYSTTDIYGNLKTGEDLAISERLKEFRDLNRDFYEHIIDDQKFQSAYDNMIQDLVTGNNPVTPGSDIYNERVDTWLEHNTTTQVTETWYDERKRLLDERATLLEPLTAKNASIIDIGPLYDEIYSLAKPSKDTSGEYNGQSLTKEVQSKIRDKHEQIEEARNQLYTKSGLTKSELEDYKMIGDYFDYHGKFLNSEDQLAYNEYRKRIAIGLQSIGVSKEDLKRIQAIDDILKKMSITTFTGYYRDTFDNLVSENDDVNKRLNELLYDKIGIDRDAGDPIDENAMDEILKDDALINDLRNISPKFKEWFDNNHYQGERFIPNPEGGKGEIRLIYIRTALWSHTTPSDVSYYKAFALKDSKGNIRGSLKLKGVPRVPNSYYTDRKVKDQYMTPVIEKDYVDGNGKLVIGNKNNRGEWLPKTKGQSPYDTEFINDEYQKMFDTNRAMWDMVDYIKTQHLKNQRGLSNPQKLGIEFPRNRMERLEGMRVGYIYNRRAKTAFEAFTTSRFGESIHNLWRIQPDDFEFGNNIGSQKRDLNRLQTLTRPISGMYNIPLNEASIDIVELMGKHQYSIEMYKGLREVNSMAQVLRRMVEQETNSPEARKISLMAKTVQWITNKKGASNRAYAIGNIIETHFQGEQLKLSRIGSAKFTKLASIILNDVKKSDTYKWFSYNLPSALTNFGGAEYQMMYKTLDSRHFNAKNLAVGNVKGLAGVTEVKAREYGSTAKPLTIQFLDIMDASPDSFKKSVGERGSRNIVQDLVEGKQAYVDRDFLQRWLNYTAMYALLDNKKYRFQMNGVSTTLDNAIELVDGKIQTKSGVPKEYQIGYDTDGNVVFGDKIHQLIKHHKGYLKKTMGVAGKNSESEFMSRTLSGKALFHIMSFLPGMITDRYQFGVRHGVKGKRVRSKTIATRRSDAYIQTREYGIFIEALLAAKNTVLGIGDIATGNLKGSQIHRVYRNKSSRTAIAQVLIATLMTQLIDLFQATLMFDDEDDDPETGFTYNQFGPNGEIIDGRDVPNMIANLRKVSSLGELPLINPEFTTAKLGNHVNGENFIKLQLLNLSIRIEDENKTLRPDYLWLPVTNLASGKSAIQGGTLKDKINILSILVDMVKGRDTEIKQTAGPYIWQKGEAGYSKLWNEIGKMYGRSGNVLLPADAIESRLKFSK